jgi:hypothetical protein
MELLRLGRAVVLVGEAQVEVIEVVPNAAMPGILLGFGQNKLLDISACGVSALSGIVAIDCFCDAECFKDHWTSNQSEHYIGSEKSTLQVYCLIILLGSRA